MTLEQPTGADLARIALTAARQAARKRDGAPTQRVVRKNTAVRRDGREPVGLERALVQLLTERGWQAPAAGGSVMQQWPAIVTPDLARYLQAVHFDAETGRLDLLPASSAWATQARLTSARLTHQVNHAIGAQVVRSIRVLAPGVRETKPPAPAPAPTRTPVPASGEVRLPAPGAERARRALTDSPPKRPPSAPIRTRQDACPGYRRARAQLTSAPTARERTPAPAAESPPPSIGYQHVREALRATKGEPA
ncbi:DciA family protein [Streptomyces sp. NPDC053474]|uniref:DciA family protein n=1 Tax=Streptomyces sp. NPDC053474 TaxID=3365704 RepID=UPI0037D3B899